MNVRHLQNSFAGGEISPSMYSRIGDSKYTTGAARVKNFICRPDGPAVRRPGFVHVRKSYSQVAAKTSRLIPFVYGASDSLVLELNDSRVHFYTGGQVLKYARTREILTVNPTTDRITFKEPHGFFDGDTVRFLGGAGAVAPGGTNETTTYYVRQVSSTVIELSAFVGLTPVLDLTTVGTAPLTMIPLADYIGIPRPSAQINSVDTGANNWMDTIVGHELQTDDPIHFASTGTLPSYSNFGGGTLTAGVTYYAIRVDATFFRVALTPGGAAVDLSSTGSGTRTVYRKLAQGTVYSYPTLGPFYTRVEYEYAAHALPITGEYELPTGFLTSEHDGITHEQVGNLITITSASRHNYELTRVSASKWTYSVRTSYGATVSAPTISSITKITGESFYFQIAVTTGLSYSVSPSAPGTLLQSPLLPGDFVYCEATVGTGVGVDGNMPAAVYIVTDFDSQTPVTPSPLIQHWLFRHLTTLTPGDVVTPLLTRYGYARRVTLGAEISETYVVTALTATGSESQPSAPISAQYNILSVAGASNTVNWSAVSGAARYRVYKLQSGLYGLIGETEGLSFKDEDIPPDMSVTPPYLDTTISSVAGNVPGVVGRFEQRRIFAATGNSPQTIWFSTTDTDATLTYHLPVVDTDRIRFTLSAPEACPIRHVVPLTNLIVLTESAEFIVSPVNSDAITPTSFRARVVTTGGCSTRRPLLTNSGILFEAARGGHVQQFLRTSEGGYSNDDISIRASHLFDGQSLTSSALMKAPVQIGWWTSSSGDLLGVTYSPAEGITGWHSHDVYGTVESVCCVPEGGEDALYVVVWDGSQRALLRMREFDQRTPLWSAGQLLVPANLDIASGVYLDNSKVTDWRNKDATWSMTLSASPTWKAGASCTITSSSAIFVKGMENDGGIVRLTAANGYTLDCTISSVTSSTVATVVPTTDVPTYLRTAVYDWRFKFKVFRGFNHLDGVSVAIMADGVDVPAQTVASGTITLTTAASVVCVGRNYISRVDTLPLALRVDESAAQGRTKNINRVWVDVVDAYQFQIGDADDASLSKYETLTDDVTLADRQKVDVTPYGTWSDEGRLMVQTLGPWPITVLAVGMEVSLGP